MPFQAVIFDLFGTLIDNFRRDAFAGIVGRMAQAAGAPSAPFAAAVQRLIPGSLTGRYDIACETLLACEAIGVPCDTAQAAEAARVWRVWALNLLCTPRPGAVALLGMLRSSGVPTGLISDCVEDVVVIWPQTPLAPLIGAPVFSCREGVTKPDPAIYLRACQRLGVTPSAALYAGDTAAEVAGAQAAGLAAVRVLAAHESEATHMADRSPWDGPTVAALAGLSDLFWPPSKGL
jgi:putative hydrolase of the HAD superfamily